MKLDKNFKNEVNQELAEGSYIAKKVLFKIVLGIIILAVIGTVVGFGFKWFGVNADRIIFKNSITYNEGVLDDLAKYKLEMIMAEDEVEKIAIANLVVDRFANYDESKIETYDLKQFLKDCRNLDLEDY